MSEDSKPPASDEWTDRFVQHLRTERGVSDYTIRNYSHTLAEFQRWHSTERSSAPDWTRLQRDDFRAYLRHLGRQQLSRAAIQLRFSALRTFYKFLARRGAVEHGPIKNLAMPKREKRLPRFLTIQQMLALLNAPLQSKTEPQAVPAGPRRQLPAPTTAPSKIKNQKSKIPAGRPVETSVPDRDVAILETIYSCGLRISELCGLRGEDIDWKSQLIRVRGKGKKERQVPIGAPALQAIEVYWSRLSRRPAPAEPVFLRSVAEPRPMSPRTLQHRLKQYLAIAGLDPGLTPHKLRHSYATHLLDAGAESEERAGTVGPCPPRHHPGLHPRHHRTIEEGLRRRPSQGIGSGATQNLRLIFGQWLPGSLCSPSAGRETQPDEDMFMDGRLVLELGFPRLTRWLQALPSGPLDPGADVASSRPPAAFRSASRMAFARGLIGAALLLGVGKATGAPNDQISFRLWGQVTSISESSLGSFIEIVRSGSGQGTVQADYSLDSLSAIANQDFIAATGTVVFAPGVFGQQIVVRPIQDAVTEPDEFFNITLSNPSPNADLGGFSTLQIAITDDDGSSLYFARFKTEAHEGDSVVELQVVRTPPAYNTVTVRIGTQDVTAHAGSDYVATNALLIFLAGETNKRFAVQLIKDALPEPEEDFYVHLSLPTGPAAIRGGPESMIVTLRDDPSPVLGSCNELTLRAALALTNAPTFACDGTIRLTNSLVVTNDVTLDGGGKEIALDGGCGSRLFWVSASGRLTLRHLTLTNGCAAEGAAIYNDGGTVILDGVNLAGNNASGFSSFGGGAILNQGGMVRGTNCLFLRNQARNLNRPSAGGAVQATTNAQTTFALCRFENNTAFPGWDGGTGRETNAPGARGGAIQNQGSLLLQRCVLIGNRAEGAMGSGVNALLVTENGGYARGGALDTDGIAIVADCTFISNRVAAGTGGNGRPLALTPGNGGPAFGAAIYSQGSLRLVNSTVAFNLGTAGVGGQGYNGSVGEAGGGNGPGTSGAFGGSVWGGIYAQGTGASGNLFVTNCTICGNTLVGADGGTGGNTLSSPIYTGPPLNGGPGGGGGSASGGGIFVDHVNAWLINCTIASNAVRAGLGAPGGLGTCSRFGGCQGPAATGPDGITAAGAIGASGPGLSAINTLVAFSTGAGNGGGPFLDGGHNLSSDQCLPFTAPSSRLNLDPLLGPLADHGGPTLTMALLSGSPARDAADASVALPTDQRGIGRLIGPDIGAFESDQPRLGIRRLTASMMEVQLTGIPRTHYQILVSSTLGQWSVFQSVDTDAFGLGTVTLLSNEAQFFSARTALE